MQHGEREQYIDSIASSLERDLNKTAKSKIMSNPYIPYNQQVILDLMGKFGIQRRTAKEWLICAQIRFAEKNRKV
jgi:hypothetical protein